MSSSLLLLSTFVPPSPPMADTLDEERFKLQLSLEYFISLDESPIARVPIVFQYIGATLLRRGCVTTLKALSRHIVGKALNHLCVLLFS